MTVHLDVGSPHLSLPGFLRKCYTDALFLLNFFESGQAISCKVINNRSVSDCVGFFNSIGNFGDGFDSFFHGRLMSRDGNFQRLPVYLDLDRIIFLHLLYILTPRADETRELLFCVRGTESGGGDLGDLQSYLLGVGVIVMR